MFGCCLQYGQVANIEIKFQELEREPDESQAEEDRVGCSLKDNNDVLACRADYLYHRGEFQSCYDTTKAYVLPLMLLFVTPWLAVGWL